MARLSAGSDGVGGSCARGLKLSARMGCGGKLIARWHGFSAVSAGVEGSSARSLALSVCVGCGAYSSMARLSAVSAGVGGIGVRSLTLSVRIGRSGTLKARWHGLSAGLEAVGGS